MKRIASLALLASALVPSAARAADSPSDLSSDKDIAAAIDKYWREGDVAPPELSVERKKKPGKVDSCVKDLDKKITFGERIGYFVEKHLDPAPVTHSPTLGDGGEGDKTIAQSLSLREDPIDVGLMSHPMCKQTSSSLFHALSVKAGKTPGAAEVAKAKAFVKQFEETKSAPDSKHKLADLLLTVNAEFLGFDVHKAIFGSSVSLPDSPAEYKKLQALHKEFKKVVASADKAAIQIFLRQNPLGKISRAVNTMVNHAPDAKTIALANRFVAEHNSLRQKAKAGDKDARRAFSVLYTKLMDCLAFTESLDSPDSQKAKDIADNHYPKNENGQPGKTKGDGVEFYMDLNPEGGKQLTIGLFQFSPPALANQYPCASAWNRAYPACPIEIDSSKKAESAKNLLRAIASPLQTYNAFCGVDKITESYYTQVNTTDPARTDSANSLGDSKLKAPKDRCVSLQFRSGLSFNHFGPLQNTTGLNMNIVLSCVYAVKRDAP